MVLLSSTTWNDPAMVGQDAFFHYLPVNETTMSYGVYVTGAGQASIQPGEDYPPSGHPTLYSFDWQRGRTLPDFQLILVTEGAGEFESEATGLVCFERAALIFLFPGVWHRYRPLSEVGWRERWISFNGELVHRLFDIGLFGPSLAISTPCDCERLVAEFDELLEVIQRHSVENPAVLTFKALRTISSAIAERIKEAQSTGLVDSENPTYYTLDDPVVQRALELIWTHSHCPMSVNDIARELPVTRRTLDRRFAEATGHSVLEEINICRLSRAKRLLMETDLPVKSIARLAGFSSTERMRVAFVEREGTPPTNFRKRVAQSRDGTGPAAGSSEQRIALGDRVPIREEKEPLS
jgi:AraC-like DNA-binding protein